MRRGLWFPRKAAGARAMEMHAVRRPVKGGPARIRRKKMAAQRYRAGGPGVLRTPGRRAPHRNGGTFGSFGHERTTIYREDGKNMVAKLPRQVSCTANSAKANKEKSNAHGGAGCGVFCGVRGAGKPVRPILAASAAGRGAGFPAKQPPPQAPGRVTDPPLQRKGKRRTAAARGVPGGRSPPGSLKNNSESETGPPVSPLPPPDFRG